MSDSAVTGAQRRILDVLKRAGPTTAGALAEELAMTDVAARQHLLALERSGRVRQSKKPADGRGRPSMIWTLTDGSDAIFPDRHAALTVDLIEAMREAFGDEGLQRLVQIRADQQTDQYRDQLPSTKASIKARVEALAARRSEEGYMAEVVRERHGTYLLIEHHCPICAAAKSCTGLCSAELDVFRRALGDDLEVERTAHLLSGDDRCVYRVRRAQDAE